MPAEHDQYAVFKNRIHLRLASSPAQSATRKETYASYLFALDFCSLKYRF